MTRALGLLSLVLFHLLAVGVSAAQSSGPCINTTLVCVLTWQQDTGTDVGAGYAYRTGQDLNESTITAEAFPGNFGQLCSAPMGGQVYSQPLVATNVTISGHTYNQVAFVVTENDMLYAIQADPADTSEPACTILNGSGSGTNLLSFIPGSTQYPVDCMHVGGMQKSCKGTIGPTIGVLGTPVVNIYTDVQGNNHGTVYVVTESQDTCAPGPNCNPQNWAHWLHAIDIGSFTEQDSAPIQICASGCGSYTNGSQFSKKHIQRPGLLYVPKSLGNGTLPSDYVYIAFSMMDGTTIPYPSGMVFGFDAKNVANTIGPFQASQGIRLSDGGGIWMGGSGLAFGPDGAGHNWIYLTTGNGTYDASSNWGDSFIKLDPDTLAIPSSNGYFTPADEQWRGDDINCSFPYGNDMDFGSGGVMLIPDNELAHTNWGYLAVNGEKEGDLWFIRRDVPGGFSSSTTGCVTTPGGPDVQTFPTPGNPPNIIHNGLAFWERPLRGTDTEAHYIYVAPLSSGFIYQYTLCPSAGASNPICGNPTTYLTATLAQGTYVNSWGITPTISSASSTDTDAILWVIEKTDFSCAESDVCTHVLPNGVFIAFDAVTMTQLYSSSGCSSGRDLINQATKNSVPTVANGYVYLGTQSSNNGQNNGQGTFYIFGPGATGTC